MKKLIVTFCVVTVLLILANLESGCSSLTPNNPSNSQTNTPAIYVDTQGLLIVGNVPVDPNLIGSTVGLAASIGASQAITSDPNALAYFVTAKSVIDIALANNDYNPTNLHTALNKISMTSINNNALIKTVIVQVFNTYDKYYGALTAQQIADVSPYLGPILQGISDGFGSAITASVSVHNPAKAGVLYKK